MLECDSPLGAGIGKRHTHTFTQLFDSEYRRNFQMIQCYVLLNVTPTVLFGQTSCLETTTHKWEEAFLADRYRKGSYPNIASITSDITNLCCDDNKATHPALRQGGVSYLFSKCTKGNVQKLVCPELCVL
jgi:hypothetical protein